MKSFNRIAVFYAAAILITAGIAFAQDKSKTFTISGDVGVGGVVMQGLPGHVVTDHSGRYSVRVPYGWAGTVIPKKEGFQFRPPAITYSDIAADFPGDFAADIVTYTISGSVGIEGVTMRGLPGEPVSDSKGIYQATVEYGWSGRMTPVKKGYKFNPPFLNYSNIVRDMMHQDFESVPITMEISGNINIEGVLLQGLPGTPITNTEGHYKARVPYGFSGLVIPKKEGYEFTPPSREYSSLNESLGGHDFFAEPQMLTISDTVEMDGALIPGVLVTASSGESCITDARGMYSLQVPYGWNGEISLSKEGFDFDPPGKSFTNVRTNIRDGVPEPAGRGRDFGGYYDYRYGVAAARSASRIAGSGDRRVLVVPAVELEPEELAGTVEDMYVMSHILDERFKEPRMIMGVFRDFGDFFGRDNRETEAVYMQGYGVVFIMEVDYTFTDAQQSQQQAEDETEEGVDPTWQQARERIFSPGAGRNIDSDVYTGEYDGLMVDELKTELIRTLKHAANIRNLESEEWVILSVTGKSRQSDNIIRGGRESYSQSTGRTRSRTVSRSRRGMAYGGGSYSGGAYGGVSYGRGGMDNFETGVPPATVLTIRVKKQNIDKFSQGDIDFEQFRRKVQIYTY